MQRYDLKDIGEAIGEDYALHGASDDIYIDKITTPHAADEHSLVFISPNRQDKAALLAHTHAGVVIGDASLARETRKKDQVLIVVQDPKRSFAHIGNRFFVQKIPYSIHPSAIIHPEAVIAEQVYIGPYTYIGRCELKAHTVVHGHCYLYDNVIVHEHVTIQAGCVIGANGCGQIKNKAGKYFPFPHIGGVIIEANVEIGTKTSIAKGALANTVIKNGSVIDSFVQVGHNVIVEEDVLILANSVIGGSSIIKKDAVLAIGAHICDYVTVGEGAHVGPHTVIMTDVPARAKVMARPPLTVPASQGSKHVSEQEASL